MSDYNCYQSSQIKHSLYRVKSQNLNCQNIHKTCPFKVLCSLSTLTLTQQRQHLRTDRRRCYLSLPDKDPHMMSENSL